MRKSLILTLLCLFTLCAVAGPALAEPAAAIPVEIKAQAYDAVGQDLVQKTTALFQKDKHFKVVQDSTAPRIVIHLSTMGFENSGMRMTAYSEVVAFDLPGQSYQTYIGSTVGVCGGQEVPDDAKGIVYNVTKLTESYPDLLAQIQQTK